MSVRLKVFISSGMAELRDERRAMQAALRMLEVEPWLFEEDAGAQTIAGRDVYLRELNASDLYIGIFWRQYGRYTIDEYEQAVSNGKDCLIFEKSMDIGDRDPRLALFLEQIGGVETGRTIKRFTSIDQLATEVRSAVASWQTRKIREQRHRAIPPLLAYRCDRSEQIGLVQGQTQTIWSKRDTRNVVWVVHGNRAECHRELVDVLARYSLPPAVADRGVRPVHDVPVSWPDRATDYDEFAAQLTARISERALKRVSDVVTAAGELDGHPGPVLVHTYVEPRNLKPTPRQAVQRFVRYWNDWPRRSAGDPLFPFLCVRYMPPPRGGVVSRLFRGADSRLADAVRELLADRAFLELCEREFPNTRVLVARELPDVGLDEAELWVDLDDVIEFVGDRTIEVRKRIGRLYEDPTIITEQRHISMDPLAAKLEAILKEVSA